VANYLSFYVERVYDNPKGARAPAPDPRHRRVWLSINFFSENYRIYETRKKIFFDFQRLHGNMAGAVVASSWAYI